MQTVTGKNLWRRHGRLNFPLDGLVLYLPLWEPSQATLLNGTGIATGVPIVLVGPAAQTIDCTQAGTFLIYLPKGATGTATSGTMTVNGSPVALVGGLNTITTSGAIGNFTVAAPTLISKELNARVCTVTEATAGVTGRTFDGTDDKINVPAHASLTLTTVFSVGCWVRTPRITGANGWEHIIGKMDTGVDVFSLFQDQNDGGVDAHIKTSSGYAFPLIYAAEHSNFHHIFVTFDSTLGSLQIKTYHNGGLVTEATLGGTMISNATVPVTLGRTTANVRPLQGTIGDVWWYSTRALNVGEIEHSYQATKWKYL